MSYNAAPKSFFGPTYALASSNVSFGNSTSSGVSVGNFTVDGTTADLTFASAHNLKTGDLVTLTTSAADLPSGLATGTTYHVVATPSNLTLQISATSGGAAIIPSDVGTGTHTLTVEGALQEVTDTEANETSGDWRKVIFGLMEMLYKRFTATPVADRPTNINIVRSSSVNDATGRITRNYFVSIVTEVSGTEVAPE